MTAVPLLTDGELTLRVSQQDEQVVIFDVEHGRPVGTIEVRRTSSGVGLVVWELDGGPEVAQRALRLVSEFAFKELGLDRLQVEVDPEIHASGRVAAPLSADSQSGPWDESIRPLMSRLLGGGGAP